MGASAGSRVRDAKAECRNPPSIVSVGPSPFDLAVLLHRITVVSRPATPTFQGQCGQVPCCGMLGSYLLKHCSPDRSALDLRGCVPRGSRPGGQLWSAGPGEGRARCIRSRRNIVEGQVIWKIGGSNRLAAGEQANQRKRGPRQSANLDSEARVRSQKGVTSTC